MEKKKLSTIQKLSLTGIITIGVAATLILTGAQTPTETQTLKSQTPELLEYSNVESEQLDTVTQWLNEDRNERKQASISAEKKRLAKLEEERIAREKAEAEEAARIAAEEEAARIAAEEAELARIAEEERLAAEAEAQAAYEAEQAEIAAAEVVATEVVAASEPAQEVAYEAPAARTDGFNFNGYHYDIASFSGSGYVPQWTPYIYQWTSKPNHYLVEMMSDAGSAIRKQGITMIMSRKGTPADNAPIESFHTSLKSETFYLDGTFPKNHTKRPAWFFCSSKIL